MNTFKNTLYTSLFALILGFSTSAFALDLTQAKNSGLVGETPSGYLEAVASSASANALIKDINAKRKQHYQKISKRNNTSLATIEKLAGEKAIEKTVSGNFYKKNGIWVKK